MIEVCVPFTLEPATLSSIESLGFQLMVTIKGDRPQTSVVFEVNGKVDSEASTDNPHTVQLTD